MKVKDPHEKIKKIRCVCCGEPVTVDQWGQGRCSHCKWFQAEYYQDYPDRVIIPNMVTLNRARKLFKEGKPFKPTFEEFLMAWEDWGELEFHYKSRRYGLRMGRDDEIRFYEWNVKEGLQTFNTIEEFRDNAHIGGVLLKDLWNDVEYASAMRG
jgi:hypothetical protein